jgi:hypothetical protein
MACRRGWYRAGGGVCFESGDVRWAE